MTARPRTSSIVLRVVLTCALLSHAAVGAATPAQDDLSTRKQEIVRILDNDLVRHAEANGGDLVPDDTLEWDVSRLEAQLGFMDNALRSIPCGTKVPPPPEAGAALAALRALSRLQEVEARLAEFEEEQARIEERKQYVEEIHAIATMVYKLHLIGAMTELLVHAVPVDDVLTIVGVLDDARNFTEPGDVPDWKGRDQYKQYIAENQVAVELGVVNKLRRMDRFDENGDVKVGGGELLRLIAEVVRAETDEEANELEAQAKQVEQSMAEARAEVDRANERDRYFHRLIESVETAIDESVWIQDAKSFVREEVVLSVLLVDDASGHAIESGRVTVSSAASVEARSGEFRFRGLSRGTLQVKASAGGYQSRTVSVDVESCGEHSSVVRLTPAAAVPATVSPTGEVLNRPPTVSLAVDADRVASGGTLQLTAVAEDPERQGLAYVWSASAGRIEGSGPHVEVETAGLAPQSITVMVTVRDPEGAMAQDSRTLTVTPPKALTAELSCGGRLELVAGEVDRSCGVVVQGWRGNTDERVEVIVSEADSSGSIPGGVVVFPDRTSQAPANMFTAGTTDFHERYEFPLHFSARATAPEGRVPVSLVVRQKGAGEVRLSLTVNVLPKGRIAVPGAGEAPPSREGTGGEYCVWRYKLFSETRPNCWQFVAATCNDPRYGNSRNGYILAGSNMTRVEADGLITEQSAYFSDCGETTTDGRPEGESRAGSGDACHDLASRAGAALDGGETQMAGALVERAEREGCGDALGDVVRRLNETRLEREARREERERLCAELGQLVQACQYQEASAVGAELRAAQPEASCPGVDLGGLQEQALRESEARAMLQRAQTRVRLRDLDGAMALLRGSLARAPACMASEIESRLADMEARASAPPAWLGEPPGSEPEGPPEEESSSDVPGWLVAGGSDDEEEQERSGESRPPGWLTGPVPSGVSEENRERAERVTADAGRQLDEIQQEEAERQRRLEAQRREEERRRRELERQREEERRLARARAREKEEAERRREEAERAERGRSWAQALDRVVVALVDESIRRRGGGGGAPPPSSPPSSPPEEDFLEDIVVRSYRVTISVWDAECEDGDRISVYINGTPFLTNRTLSNAKESFTVDLPYESNTIEVVALNGGTDCPPGKKPPDQTVNSGAISISSAVRGGQQRWRLRQRGGSTARLTVRP